MLFSFRSASPRGRIANVNTSGRNAMDAHRVGACPCVAGRVAARLSSCVCLFYPRTRLRVRPAPRHSLRPHLEGGVQSLGRVRAAGMRSHVSSRCLKIELNFAPSFRRPPKRVVRRREPGIQNHRRNVRCENRGYGSRAHACALQAPACRGMTAAPPSTGAPWRTQRSSRQPQPLRSSTFIIGRNRTV